MENLNMFISAKQEWAMTDNDGVIVSVVKLSSHVYKSSQCSGGS